MKTDEKRKVKFVTFSLTDEQKKLTGKQRIDVLQKLADKANDFTDALQVKGADFDQVVAKFQLTPKETGGLFPGGARSAAGRDAATGAGGFCPNERFAEQRRDSDAGRFLP